MLRPRPEKRVLDWLVKHQDQSNLSAVVIGEISAGIKKLRPVDRPKRLEGFLNEVRRRYVSRIHAFDEAAALIYGDIVGRAHRSGFHPSVPDGMIAAIALRHRALVATRNTKDFANLSVKTVNPWET